MKLLIAAILALSFIGCAGKCADGSGSFLVWERGNYKACGMECDHEKTPCGCSAQCPCWKKHP